MESSNGINLNFLLAQIFNLVLTGSLLVAVFVIVRRLVRRPGHSALEILKQRLARGDINAQEYERLRALIVDEQEAKPKRRPEDESTVDAAYAAQTEAARQRQHGGYDDDGG